MGFNLEDKKLIETSCLFIDFLKCFTIQHLGLSANILVVFQQTAFFTWNSLLITNIVPQKTSFKCNNFYTKLYSRNPIRLQVQKVVYCYPHSFCCCVNP